jgi:hypothetical protein
MRDHNDTKLVEKRERGANVGIATERRREVKKPSTPPPSFLGSTNRELEESGGLLYGYLLIARAYIQAGTHGTQYAVMG